jgi:hypothetical protein
VDENSGTAPDAAALRVHAAAVRALGESQWADLAARMRVLTVPDGAFGDAAALARLPQAYAAVREELADRAGRAAGALAETADTLDELATRYQRGDGGGR